MRVTYIDPQTGGYEEVNGSLLTSHPAVNKVNRLLSQKIGQDIVNPQYGNPLITNKNLSVNDIVNGINFCLTPLTSTGEIAKLAIDEIRKTARGRWLVKLTVLPSNQDEPETIMWQQPTVR